MGNAASQRNPIHKQDGAVHRLCFTPSILLLITPHTQPETQCLMQPRPERLQQQLEEGDRTSTSDEGKGL